MARFQTFAILAILAFAGAASARGLKQDEPAAEPVPAVEERTTGTTFDPTAPDPADTTFTFTFAPKLNVDPELALLAAALAPSLGISVTPLSVNLEQSVAGTGSFSPGTTVRGSTSFTPGESSVTVEGSPSTTTVTAPAPAAVTAAQGAPNGAALLNVLLQRMAQGAATRQQVLGNLGGGALLNRLG